MFSPGSLVHPSRHKQHFQITLHVQLDQWKQWTKSHSVEVPLKFLFIVHLFNDLYNL